MPVHECAPMPTPSLPVSQVQGSSAMGPTGVHKAPEVAVAGPMSLAFALYALPGIGLGESTGLIDRDDVGGIAGEALQTPCGFAPTADDTLTDRSGLGPLFALALGGGHGHRLGNMPSQAENPCRGLALWVSRAYNGAVGVTLRMIPRSEVDMQAKSRRKNPEMVFDSRQEAVERQYAAGLKHLHRPNDPHDPYFTQEAVRAWAERQTDAFIVKGIIAISERTA